MHEERRLFMQRLVRERDRRMEDEHKSAVLCQAMFRGRLERRRSREGADGLGAPPVPPRRFGLEIRGESSQRSADGDDTSWRSRGSPGDGGGSALGGGGSAQEASWH